MTTHGEGGHGVGLGRGRRRTRLYSIWLNMRNRCNNPGHPSYSNYGGRGIRICREWDNYVAFRDWALASGYSPKLQIDREDNNGPYSPYNCRWVTAAQNKRNTRVNIWVSAWGETKILPEWVEDTRCQVSYSVLKQRLKLGWNPERALVTPKLTKGGKLIMGGVIVK